MTYCTLRLSAEGGLCARQHLPQRNWLIGSHIEEYERRGVDRQQYGQKLLDRLSKSLIQKGVSRCDRRELYRYRQFYLTYPQIRESLPPQSAPWLGGGEIQHVIFVDPKGIRNLGSSDPKIQFYETIKDIEQRLGDANIHLYSFIVSNTPSHTMKMLWDMDKPAMESCHILFQEEDQDTYIQTMLTNILAPVVQRQIHSFLPLSSQAAIVGTPSPLSVSLRLINPKSTILVMSTKWL